MIRIDSPNKPLERSYMMKTHYFMAIYALVLFGISACDKPLPSTPESNPPAADSLLVDPSAESALQAMRDETSNAMTNMADAAADKVEDVIENIQDDAMDGASDKANGAMQDLMDATAGNDGETTDGAAQNMVNGTMKKATDAGKAAMEGLIKDRAEASDDGVIQGMMEQ
ncbi:MAG: hypothetical protein ACI88U_001122 [Porticoccaceae bacterium]|jgi:hypothetical protein